jgi:hypothetical protein
MFNTKRVIVMALIILVAYLLVASLLPSTNSVKYLYAFIAASVSVDVIALLMMKGYINGGWIDAYLTGKGKTRQEPDSVDEEEPLITKWADDLSEVETKPEETHTTDNLVEVWGKDCPVRERILRGADFKSDEELVTGLEVTQEINANGLFVLSDYEVEFLSDIVSRMVAYVEAQKSEPNSNI